MNVPTASDSGDSLEKREAWRAINGAKKSYTRIRIRTTAPLDDYTCTRVVHVVRVDCTAYAAALAIHFRSVSSA